MRAQDLELIARVPLFSGFGREALARATASAVVRSAAAGAVLFREGEAAEYLHVILGGQVGLLGTSADGEETMVEILKGGEAFIEAAVLTGRPYLMTAKALQPARLLLLPGEHLRREIRANPDLAIAMLTSVSTHFRMLVREVKSLKLKSAAQRLGGYLLTLAPRPAGHCVLRLPYSKAMIAARIGIRPESLSRAFSALEAAGVAAHGRSIVIDDVARLAMFCRDTDPV